MFRFDIQTAHHKDVVGICKIISRVMTTELSQKQLEEMYTEIIEDIGQIVIIARHARVVAGYIRARRLKDFSRGCYAEISEIALLPYYQRRGGGTELVYGVEKWGGQMLIPKIICNLQSDNEGASALLKKCRFIETRSGAFEKIIFERKIKL